MGVQNRAKGRHIDLVFFLFLANLGVGIVFTLVLVSREAGVKFFRFNAGLAASLIAVALAFRPSGGGGPGGTAGPGDVAGLAGVDSQLAGVLFVALIVAEAAILVYWATVGRRLASIRPAIVAVAIGAGIVALIAEALAYGGDRRLPMQVLTVASVLSSAAFLGSTCTAMILGHWYLILPSMQVSHLQSIVKVHIASMLVRVAVVAAAIFLSIVTWAPGLGLDFGRYITSVTGVFFWQRMLFGLAGPAFLSYLTWETAKIRSTQSATGILYVDFFTVVVGEVLATYLLLATHVPV